MRDPRRKLLEEENRRLKQLVADLSLDKLMLQDLLQKIVKSLRVGGAIAIPGMDLPGKRAPRMRGLAIRPLVAALPAIRTIGLLRGIQEKAAARVHYGYFRNCVLLGREWRRTNHKRA